MNKKRINRFISEGNIFEFIPAKIKPKPVSDFITKLQREVVFMWDDDSQMLIKSIPLPNSRFLAKLPPDGEEFEIRPDSHQVTRAVVGEWEVSKEDYDNNRFPPGATK